MSNLGVLRAVGFLAPVVVVLSAAGGLRALPPVYVDADATGPAHDGTTWCEAYTDLQTALTNADAGTEIRVAAGTYKPTTGTSRMATFRLKTGVQILGGYAGCGEPDPDERDFVVHETILSGDLLNNDDATPASTCCTAHVGTGCDNTTCQTTVCGERPSCCSTGWDRSCAVLAAIYCCQPCGNRCDNAYQVVRIDNFATTDETAVLDGVTITGGFANGTDTRERGAGIFIYFFESSPTFKNCTIRGNVAKEKAGGVYNHKTTASFSNCVFTGNIAPTGGAMYNIESSPSLLNCTLSGNLAIANAGGVWNVLGAGDFPVLHNCILWGNADSGGTDESAQMNPGNGNVIMDFSILQGWTGVFGGEQNHGFDPRLVDPAGPDGVAGTGDEDLRLDLGSPAINTSDPAIVPEPEAVDATGGPRRQGCRVDRGAFETDTPQQFGDFDGDDVLTLVDVAYLQLCFDPAISDPAWPDVCRCVFDNNGDDDISLADYGPFHDAYSNP